MVSDSINSPIENLVQPVSQAWDVEQEEENCHEDGFPNDIVIDLLDGYCFHRRQVFAFAVFAALLALQQHLDS